VLGNSASDQNGTNYSGATSGFIQLTTTWTPTQDYTSARVGFWGNRYQSAANTVYLDDFEVWDTASATSNIPSLSAYDADGHPVASILPGAFAGYAPMVTRTAYDSLGRVTDVTVDGLAGAGETAAATNLRTHTAYDSLGRQTDSTDPSGHVTHAGYDRLGRVTSGVTDYGTGHLNLTALAAYDAIGELTATCSPDAVVGGCTSSNITTNSLAWGYGYDAAGHQTSATPPDNTTATDLASTSATYELSGAGRLHQTTQGPRTTTYTYDDLGRTTQVSVATTGVGTLTTTSTLDGAGRTTQVATSGTSSDTLTESYDVLDRLSVLSRSGNTISAFTYNPDGTAASRTDYDPAGGSHSSSFTYTALGQLASASLPDGAGTASYTWRLDGNLATRSWGSYISGTYDYDAAKRPIGLVIDFGQTQAGTIERDYDRSGNATAERQNLSGIGGLSGSGQQSFSYDGAGRLTDSSFGGAEARHYTYDPSGNRITVSDSGATFYLWYDSTDAVIKKGPNADGTGAASFSYDSLGQLTGSQPSSPDSATLVPTSYAYG
jgi:YD repeat-containing protein